MPQDVQNWMNALCALFASGSADAKQTKPANDASPSMTSVDTPMVKGRKRCLVDVIIVFFDEAMALFLFCDM